MEAAVKFLDVPVKLLGKVQTVQLKIIYPHAIFSILFHYYPGEFAKKVLRRLSPTDRGLLG